MYPHKALEEILKQAQKREGLLWKSLDRWVTEWGHEYMRNMRLAHRLRLRTGTFVPPTDFSLHFRLLAIASGGCPKCGEEMTGYTDYDGLNAFLAKDKSLEEVRQGLMCKNLECGYEEKVNP